MKDPTKPYAIKKIFESSHEYTTDEMNCALPKLESPTVVPASMGLVQITPDDFWKEVAKIDCSYGLSKLSGATELNSDTVEIENSSSGKHKIIVNGKIVSSCWVDQQGCIGSHSNGGPTIANWIHWYGHDWSATAEIIKKYFPELKKDNDCLNGFGGVV